MGQQFREMLTQAITRARARRSDAVAPAAADAVEGRVAACLDDVAADVSDAGDCVAHQPDKALMACDDAAAADLCVRAGASANACAKRVGVVSEVEALAGDIAAETPVTCDDAASSGSRVRAGAHEACDGAVAEAAVAPQEAVAEAAVAPQEAVAEAAGVLQKAAGDATCGTADGAEGADAAGPAGSGAADADAACATVSASAAEAIASSGAARISAGAAGSGAARIAACAAASGATASRGSATPATASARGASHGAAAPAPDAAPTGSAVMGGVVATTAPRVMSLPRRVLAVTLSVLLVSTMWTDASIAEARTRVLGDAANVAANDDAKNGAADADQNAKDAEDAAATDADKDADASAADTDADAATAADGDQNAPADADADAAGDDAPAANEPDLDSFLPQGLVDADKVIPSVSDKLQQTKRDHLMTTASAKADDVKRALQGRFGFDVAASGALQASDGAYPLAGTTLNLAADLGNLDVLLDGGYLGAVEDTDVVALTFTAPFV